jgi:hypothetical protein
MRWELIARYSTGFYEVNGKLGLKIDERAAGASYIVLQSLLLSAGYCVVVKYRDRLETNYPYGEFTQGEYYRITSNEKEVAG